MSGVTTASAEQSPTARLLGLAAGFGIFQAVYVAAKLGLADALVGGQMSVDAIAAKTGAQPRALYRLLRALASVGVFAEEGRDIFRHTANSAMLRSDLH